LLSQKLLPVAPKKNDSNILLNFHEHLTEVKLKSSMRSNHDELAVKYHAKIIGRTCTTALLQQPEPSAPAPPLDSTLQECFSVHLSYAFEAAMSNYLALNS
jgi:hypothetical protein